MIKLLPDVDTGIDDALALFFLSEAQKKDQLEIPGCTTVGGNAEVAQTSRNTLKIWEMAGAKIPVASGAESPLMSSLNAEPFVLGDDCLGNSFLPAPKGNALKESAANMILRLRH